jgi:hypothetical protein
MYDSIPPAFIPEKYKYFPGNIFRVSRVIAFMDKKFGLEALERFYFMRGIIT